MLEDCNRIIYKNIAWVNEVKDSAGLWYGYFYYYLNGKKFFNKGKFINEGKMPTNKFFSIYCKSDDLSKSEIYFSEEIHRTKVHAFFPDEPNPFIKECEKNKIIEDSLSRIKEIVRSYQSNIK